MIKSIDIQNNNQTSFFTKLSQLYSNISSPFYVGIDLGTAMTRMAIPNKGIVCNEASYIGFNTKTNEYIFWGNEAKAIFGKTPSYIQIVTPVQNSILSDFDSCVQLLSYFISQSIMPYYTKEKFIKTGIIGYCTISSSATEVEQKATREAIRRAGFSDSFLIEKSYCAATGAGCDIYSNNPSMIIDIGAGSCEISVIIMGGIVISKTIHSAGDQLDKLIINYIHLKYGLIIGAYTAENLKINLLNYAGKNNYETIRGKSLEDGLPKSIRVSSNDIKEAVTTGINSIIDGVKEVIESIPAEIIDGAVKKGAYITGGIGNIEGFTSYFSSEVKLKIHEVDKPSLATIIGLKKLLLEKDRSKRLFF